ncbi:lipase family protein [Rhodococcus sp. UNC363MFTsu5.1]|uniref:lipase family protein n=1 Tax=Rhodococcus sp. UNC363MFTsu5.1 TaxID=1449069 RepID=UPI0004861EC2|nr:lipase family protein [Rhodococcus sp. UNC363MFTsu5.1]
MRRSARVVLGLVVASAAALTLGVAPTAAAEPLPGPMPLADNWFQGPADLSGYANGDVIRSRPVEVRFPANTAWPVVKTTQLLYRTSDSFGAPVTTATTVMIPDRPWTGPGARPLLSQQQAMDALGLQCNPSVTLPAGKSQDLALISPMLALGYAVVTSDYQGPEMAWIAGRQTAHGVLDGIRAAQRFEPLGLSQSPVVLYGYSGGGHATAWAAEQKATYAPELNIIGAAEGGVPGDLAGLSEKQPAVGFTAWGTLLGLSREYPDKIRPQDYLNPEGIEFAKALTDGCLPDLLGKTKGISLAQYSKVGDILTIPSVKAVIEENSLARTAATPDMPLFVFHDTKDVLIPDWGMTGVVREYCNRGVDVQFAPGLGVDHVGGAFVGMPPAYKWLDDRVVGRPTTPNC